MTLRRLLSLNPAVGLQQRTGYPPNFPKRPLNRIDLAVSKLMFDVHNQSAPINILKLFTKISHIHTYNTRSSKSQFFSTKYSRLNLQKRLSGVLVSKFAIRYQMNLKHQKIPLIKK